jgi:hypothetical protein
VQLPADPGPLVLLGVKQRDPRRLNGLGGIVGDVRGEADHQPRDSVGVTAQHARPEADQPILPILVTQTHGLSGELVVV